MERFLEYTEKLCLGMQTICAVEYAGVVDNDVLQEAYRILCKKHPILNGAVTKRGNDFLVNDQANSQSKFEYYKGNPDDILDAISSSWRPDIGLSQVISGRCSNSGFVILRLDHSIADGRRLTSLFQQLWKIYTDLIAGRAPNICDGTPTLRPSILLDEYFARAFRGPIDSETYSPSHNNVKLSTPIRRYLRLSEFHSEKIISLARSLKTSVHGLLCGAIMIAQRRLDKRHICETPMNCWTIVDLRSRITPAAESDATTVLVASQKTGLSVTSDDDPTRLGKEINHVLNISIHRRALFINLLHRGYPHVEGALVDQRLASAIVSNLGSVSSLDQPPEMKATNLRIFQIGDIFMPFYSFTCYERRIGMEFYFPSHQFSINEAEELVAGARYQLESLGNKAAL